MELVLSLQAIETASKDFMALASTVSYQCSSTSNPCAPIRTTGVMLS